MSSTWLLASATTIALASSSPMQPRFDRSDRPPPVDTMIDVGGHRLHFRAWAGSGDLTVVFEAGGGADLTAWATVPSLLAARIPARIVAYDRAGMGQSDVGPRDLTAPKEIEQLDRALDKLGVRRVVLVGHSYGGLLSLYHAAHQPDRVAGLVLVDPMNPIFVDKVTLTWLQTTVPDIPDPKTPKEITITRMKRDMADFVGTTRPAAAAIQVPMIVITAGRLWFGKPLIDSAWRQSHEALVAAGKRRELVVATQSQHGIPATEPDLIVGAVERILALAEPARKH